jgi:CubicO group peptidase (beta-lactamase class C family)
MKQILTLISFLLLFVNTIFGQANKENDVIKRIDNYLSKLENIGFDGSVLVELNGEKRISKGFGFTNKAEKIKNSPTTVFDIGSITKQFTAAALLKLEMQGKLSTDDKITKYFENVPTDKSNITIHDILRHQSGLQSDVGNDYGKISQSEFLDTVMNSKLDFAVGTKYSYSNIGYSLLAMIIEKVTSQTYESYLYENLWKPAQMEMTGYSRPQFDKNKIAIGYEKDNTIWGKPTDKAWDKSSPYWHLKGNGGILSTTEDLYKWHKALMTDLVLSKDAKQKLYHPTLRTGETENSYYAYGWNVSQTNRNTTQVEHSGTNLIFFADFLRYIDENITVIMLSNKSHPSFNNICFEISRIIFNSKFIPEIQQIDNAENRGFTNRIITTIEEFGLEKAKEAYNKRKKNEHLLEFLMRNEGFDYLGNNKPDIAVQIFEMDVFIYPKSAKALQGLGEGYSETGKIELALKYLKESLIINPDNPFVNRLIKKLEK